MRKNKFETTDDRRWLNLRKNLNDGWKHIIYDCLICRVCTATSNGGTRRRRRRACNRQRGSDGEFHDASRLPTPEPEPQEPKEETYWYSGMLREATAEMEDQDLLKPEFSGKLSMLITILRESETLGDKILVFR